MITSLRSGRAALTVVSLAFVAVVALGLGALAERRGLFPFGLLGSGRVAPATIEGSSDQPSYGRWERAPSPASSAGDSLAGLGYAGGYEAPTEVSGVSHLDAARMAPGHTLLCSGHATCAQLLAPDGTVAHTWQVPFEEAFGPRPAGAPRNEHHEFLRRAHVYENGDLLALFEYGGLVRVDKESKRIWSRLNNCHHDFEVHADGTILAVSQRFLDVATLTQRFPGIEAESSIADDELVWLAPDGTERARVSLFEALTNSPFSAFLVTRLGDLDLFHTNSVEELLREDQCWSSEVAVGDVLVSVRNQNALFVVRPSARSVVWMATGEWNGQHQASILAGGNMLLLDNKGGNRAEPFREDRSRVIEWDPRTRGTVWSYGGVEGQPLFTHWLGYVERLPNGNTLITESTRGRVLEVTSGGEIVWQYVSPNRSGEDSEFIATLMGAQRVSPNRLTFLSGH
ncbi:MAG: arylsulfotransferase family protein [Planctomycetota bacterium]